MISDTSCSLRAADMESPLPRWPTLLETKGTRSGPAPRQPGTRGRHSGTDPSPQVPQRRRVGSEEGPGLTPTQTALSPGVQGRAWSPQTHPEMPEPFSLLRCPPKDQPHRSTYKSQLCLFGPVPQCPPRYHGDKVARGTQDREEAFGEIRTVSVQERVKSSIPAHGLICVTTDVTAACHRAPTLRWALLHRIPPSPHGRHVRPASLSSDPHRGSQTQLPSGAA